MTSPSHDVAPGSAPSEPDPDRSASATARDDVTALQREVKELRRAMASRAAIEQAKGMLMLTFDLSETVAFDLLVRWSQEHNVKVRDLAVGMTCPVVDPVDPGGETLGRTLRQTMRAPKQGR